MNGRSSGWWCVVVAVVCSIVISGCAMNPVTGRREITLVSPEQELEIGRQGYAPVLAEYGLYEDPALQSYVNGIGQRVAKVSHLPGLEWHFTVVDDPAVNAFAMPGGYIYVTRGLLAHLGSEAQLAGVLGHEIGHVTRRHSAAQMTQQQLYGAGLALASVMSRTVQRYSGAAQQALGLLFLKFSRTDESQADELGVEYATLAGFDPREIPATYHTLARLGEASGQRLPGFMSTHPDPGDRQRVTGELAQKAAAGKSGLIVNMASYLPRLDGLLYGQDPRQGYFVGDVYYHPTMLFQLRFPAGWLHRESHASVVAVDAAQTAGMQLSVASGAGATSPAAFVANLKSTGAVAGVKGAEESVHGLQSWVGQLDVTPTGQPTQLLAAGFIRMNAGLFQILGQSKAPGDANERLIFGAIRSMDVLRDASRIRVAPDLVRVRAAGTAGSFESVLRRLGAEPSRLQDDVMLNDIDLARNVTAGALLKFVVRSNP